jgi:hypothetical protein
VAQFHLNSLYVTGYSDKASGMWVLIPHLDYSAETVIELYTTMSSISSSPQGEVGQSLSLTHHVQITLSSTAALTAAFCQRLKNVIASA